VVIIRRMSDKPRPVDDLKEGLGLLFRAAKGAASRLPTGKIEGVAKDAVKEVGRAFETIGSEIEKVVPKDAVKEVGRAFETIGSEIEKVVEKVSGGAPPAAQPPQPPPEPAEAKKEEPAPPYDDGYAPEPPKGPRVG
jgi:hypothetical protein